MQCVVLAALVLQLTTVLGATPVPTRSICTLDRATGTTIDREPLLTKGYGTRWNFAIDRVAYSEPGDDGFYRIWTMRPDGSDRRMLTGGQEHLPTKHHGMQYWHPAGRYLLFAAEKQEWKSPALFGNPDYEALPGFGLHDDLWLITEDGKRVWQLTNEANTKREGLLLPVFSPDGKHIAWSQRHPDKTYEIKLADFVEAPEPHLENIRSYSPGGAVYYEPGSFSSDSRSLTYSSDADTHSFWRSQIYRLDLDTGKATRLTVGNDYNEHPTVVKTPDGDWIIYMSTKGVQRFPHAWFLGTDWYAMRIDGSGAKRLSTMNNNQPDNPESFGAPQIAGTVSISPRGDSMLGDVQDKLAKQSGLVRVVHFVCD
jgi:Tol biopolymer transport system component